MVAVYAHRYTKAHLDRAPEDERTFFLMLCHLLNDTRYFQTVILATLNGAEGEGPDARASVLMAFTLLRMKAGRLREGYTLIKDQWSPLAKRYPELPTGHATVKELRRYFNDADNIIHRVRNDAGFHETPARVKAAYNSFPDRATLSDYYSDRGTLYGAADDIRAVAMAQIIGHPTLDGTMLALAHETIRVSDLFVEFALEFIPAFYDRYIPELAERDREEMRVEIADHSMANSVARFFATPASD